MVQYIIEIAREVMTRSEAEDAQNLYPTMEVLVEELNRLDPRDFPYDTQYRLVMVRKELRVRAMRQTTSCPSGGAVAVNIDSGDTPLVLLCPAWNWSGTVGCPQSR